MTSARRKLGFSCSAVIVALVLAALPSVRAQPAGPAYRESDFLTHIRQLTTEGRRAGEGYWSPDGKRMVFQSEREKHNPFYQIYVMDLDTGHTRRISPGIGKTTCAFFRPGSDEILFSSTHHDPQSRALQDKELALRASGAQRRYAWDFDPEMDIYVYREGDGALKRLTTARGYDAEAAYSPDGRWIVFSSTRHAYDRTLTAEEQKQLDRDPGYFGEIYIMRADGSGETRLTHTPGYDGGPFFTHDGKRIVWRRFDADGRVADVYTMNTDGTDVKRVTDFGAVSWAPYEHASGEYIVFASSKLGHGNFELFIADIEGRKEPVRVTYSEGFDGLPVPSPDGKRLAWTSSRAGAGAGQIFVAGWNHEKALEGLRNAPLRRSATAEDNLARIRAHVTTLASDAYAGRATGSAGEQRASEYISSQLRRIGARPLPGRSDYRDRFEFAAGAHDGGSSIAVSSSRAGGTATTFDSRADVQALSISDDGSVSGPLVFAGYGIVLPQNEDAAYDSYASLDVKDKIVVVLRYFPERADRKTKTLLARYSNLRYKATAARQRGAKAMIVVTGPESPNAGEIVPMTFDPAIAGSGIVAVSVSAQVARTLFAGSRASLERMQRALDSGDLNARGFELPGIAVSVKSVVVREKRSASNVLAYLPATAVAKPAEKPWIAIGAHFDHLGHGESGNSLAGKGEVGAVHPGADDNASGVAAVLAIAEALASQPRARDVLLAFWSGEEIGLLGSSAFLRSSPIGPGQFSAYLNLDMVGRMQDNRLVVQAAGTSPSWPTILEEVNRGAGFNLVLQGDPYQPTDVAAFNEAKVPTLNFFTGGHSDYHRPSDTADKIDYPNLARVAQFVTALAQRIARLEPAPAFAKVEQRVASGDSRAGVRVSTGTIPDYTASAKGLVVGGVIAGGPADKAGLQKGDLIIELAGQAITNIYDYTYILGALKAGESVAVVYMRDGQRKKATITPTARQ